MPYEPIVTTQDLPFSSRTFRSVPQRTCARLEDVPDLDAARAIAGSRTIGCRVAIAHLGGLDRAVESEIAPHTPDQGT